jgi:TPR repeat protein
LYRVLFGRYRIFADALGAVALLMLAAVPLARADDGSLDSSARSALVVGNASYSFSPLLNPINDARALAGSLHELGFAVTLVEDADAAELATAVERLAETSQAGGIGLFYYAGHAVQHRGINYLLPVDFTIERGHQLKVHSVSVNTVLDTLEQAGVGLKLVILDACRNYPFGEINEAFGQGLAGVTTRGETLVAYATSAGEFALDGNGPNSPYTSALISALEFPEQDIYDVFRNVRARVREATDGRQLPWVSGSIETQVVLRETGPEPAAPPGPDLATVHWRTIRASADPSDFSQFLRLYPESEHIVDAVARAKRLDDRDAPSPGPLLTTADLLIGPNGEELEVTPCDLFAADPDDPLRITPGIPGGLVNTRHAIRACAAAVAQDPDSPRLNFQLARALDIAERFEEALSFYRRADAAGYPKALFNIGFMHRTARGLPQDFAAGAEHYYEAALEGVPVAREALAKMYEEGWGVPQSYEQSFHWRELAAADGYAPAIDALGTMYERGWGVEVDLEEAFRQHRKAAALGWGNGLSNIGKMYAEGRGVSQDLDEALRWFAEATEQGHAYAPYHWAGLLREGDGGLEADPRRALALYQLSADRGFEWALWKIAQIYEQGDLGAPDLERAYQYYWVAREAGGMRRNTGADQLSELSEEKLAALRERLGDDRASAAEATAEAWIEQNGLLQFTLTSVY